MSMGWACFGDLSSAVLFGLDVQSLACVEAAGKIVDKNLTLDCWRALASIEQRHLAWRPWLYQKLLQEITSKEKLKEIFQLKRYLNVIPEVWSPQIMLTTPCSLQLHPLDKESFFFGELADPETAPLDDSRAALAKPSLATVPLAWGIKPGESMAVGLQVESSGACVTEDVWLGLEFNGMLSGGECMSVRCAPLAGQCQIMFQRNGREIAAQVMRPLAGEHCGSVETYVTISESGDIEFLRYCKATDSLVRSGRICVVTPTWARYIFASITIQTKHVSSKTLVSTTWSASTLPKQLQSQLEQRSLSDFVFDANWSLIKSNA
jgi:hypothetical protein